jgi:hypothetical protein
VIETLIEIVNAQGILLSFRKTVTLRGLTLNPWTVIDDEINPGNLCALKPVNTGSPMVFCLDKYELRSGDGFSAKYVAQALESLGNVTTLILFNSAVEPCLAALEQDNREKVQWCSTVHSLVIYSPSQLDLTGADILQSLLRVSRKRQTAGAPFRSVTLAIPSEMISVVSSGDLAALNECIERFELLVGDDALDWNVDKYFIPNYDPQQKRRDESAFDVDGDF